MKTETPIAPWTMLEHRICNCITFG